MVMRLTTTTILGLGLYLTAAQARSCDGTQGTQPKANPSVITGQPECPQNDGDIIMTNDGSYYTFQCCMHDSSGATFIKNVQTSGYGDCIDQCAATDNCQAFRYVYAAFQGEAEGACRLYSSGEFSTTKCGNTLHDWAYLTDPPFVDVPESVRAACSTECPDADGQLYTAKNKQVFHLDCAKRFGTTPFHKTTADSLKQCVDSCASFIGCTSVDFHKRTKKCYLGKRSDKPTTAAPGWASAHSSGCSGACDQGFCCDNKGTTTVPVEEDPTPTSDPIVNPPPALPPAEANCPADDNKVVDIEGQKYQIRCQKQFKTGPYSNSQVTSFTECLKTCTADQTCQGVDFWDPNGSKTCYLFTTTGEPQHAYPGGNWAAFKV